MSPVLLEPGRAYSFDYPRHNYRQLPSTIETRRIVVGVVRDTSIDPLDRTTESLNPLLVRGRWLVTGIDLDKDVERSFYSDSMANVRPLSPDELQPLKDVEYVVIEQLHVAFKTQQLGQALSFRQDRQNGAICAVLCVAPRKFNLEADEDENPVDDT